MLFSDKSDVTVVITCCGRFDLLRETLSSFFKFNTYPVKKIIITEDSGDNGIYTVIPEEHKEYFTVIVNKEKLGQIRSIDKAYALVDTDYIFHCEEDWEFYRKGFVEDSKEILKNNDKVYQVWLRSFYHDIKKDYPFHSLGEQIKVNCVSAHRLLSSKKKWQGFSFNPGLRRLSDYKKIKGGYSSFLDKENRAINVESSLSSNMVSHNMFAAILENDAVVHKGYDCHINDQKDIFKKRKKNIKIFILVITVYSLGWLTSIIF